MYRRLLIDGTTVDLPQSGISYSLVYEVSDEGFISGAYAKRSIELPSTGVNDALFEDWYAAGTSNHTTAPVLKPFSFEDGGIQIISGQAELQSGILTSDQYRFKGKSYKVELYGSNADWILQLKDVYLRDLDFTPTILKLSVIMSGWTATYDSGDYYGFTLIKWKEWSTYGQVSTQEFTPFLFIRSILDKAFDSIGYTLESDFLDSDVFKRLIMPLPMPERYPEEFSQDYINVDLAEPGTTVTSTAAAYVFPTYTQPNLNTPYNTVTGYYTCPFTGYYEVSVTASVVSTGGTWSGSFGAQVNNTSYYIANQALYFGSLLFPTSGNKSGALTYPVVYLQAGDQISFFHSYGGTDPTNVYAFSMQIRGEAEYGIGSILDFRYMLKDWKVIDLIKGLQHMFNLRFEAYPQTSTLIIEPADPYLYRQYNAPTTVAQEVRDGFYIAPATDSTQALDLQPDAELFNVSDVARTTIMGYKTNGQTEEFKELNEIIKIFDAQYVLPADRFNNTIEKKENPFFAKTIHTIDTEIQGTTAETQLQIPLIYPQNYELDPTATESNTDIEPRILYFAGYRGVPSDSLVKYGFTGGVELSPPLSFTTNYNQSSDFSLSFASEEVNGDSVPGLFEAFWMQEYARKRIGKRLECFYFWDLLSINSLTFRNKLLIDGSEWILQKIDGYSAQDDNSTKTVLILERGADSTDVAATTYSGIKGIVNPLTI